VCERLVDDLTVDVVGVAGRHRRPPAEPWRPPVEVRQLPIARPWLYEGWVRAGWPRVERATGPVDVTHATGLVPAATKAPLIVTVHDLAFIRTPERFTKHGARLMRASLDRIRRRADLVLCPSEATLDDVVRAGVGADRVRVVPLGVTPVAVSPEEVTAIRSRYGLPDRFVLFVGTREPRKNLPRLIAAVAALDERVPLVVAGADGWGDAGTALPGDAPDVRFLGFVPGDWLPPLYAAASVSAYPSEWEGFGLPVVEAMAQGTPVVTSRGTSTEEVAGGAAVLVDPLDVDDIARGLHDALGGADRLAEAGRLRAATLTWEAAATATVAAYHEVAACRSKSP
jgi:glycosyltransferase involved in cell wall biosynthesis